MTYRIIRFFFNHNHPKHGSVIQRGLTLEEAQEHCNDPETSSQTATSASAVARTESSGPWFDGYEKEE